MKYAYIRVMRILRKHYESPEVSKAIFKQNGGGGCHPARPGELGCFLLKQPSFQNVLEGPRFEISIYTPILISSPPVFMFLAVFLLKPHETTPLLEE